MHETLDIHAGATALRHIRSNGLQAADITTVAGASGGPKWLVLSGLDRTVFGDFFAAARNRRLDLIGSSIGAWRMACLAQDDPVAALERFERAYLAQRYSSKPTTEEITRVSVGMIEALLGDTGADDILDHPHRRLHVLTVECRGLLASERRALQLAGLSTTAFANAISRSLLGRMVRRSLFSAHDDPGPFAGLADLPTKHYELRRDNLREVLLASGSIPLVLSGVKVPGADDVHRDGGLTDYHLDIDFGPSKDSGNEGLVLYPHFYSHIIPGWFDKALRWRRGTPGNFDNVVLLSPSPEFIAALPGGRIPDRHDFYRMDEETRLRAWRTVLSESRRLGDEFAELVANGRWEDRVKPLLF